MVFGIGEKKKRGKFSGRKNSPKTLKEILSTAYTRELKKDPELMKEIAFTDAGHAELLHRDRETESKKKEIKKYIISEALNQIKSDPELSSQFVEAQVEEILSNGKQPEQRRGKRRKGEEDYYEPISRLSSAFEDLDQLAEFKMKLIELGIVKEDGEGSGSGGFFKGLTLKDILTAIPTIKSVLVAEQPVQKPIKVYIVQVNGKFVEIGESEYVRMMASGQLTVPKLVAPESKDIGTQSVPSLPTELPKSTTPELPALLKDIDFEEVGVWLDQEPQEFVLNLKTEVDKNQDEAKFIWGFLSTANYDGISAKIIPYKTHPKVSVLVERLLSDDGKAWTEAVLELVARVVGEK